MTQLKLFVKTMEAKNGNKFNTFKTVTNEGKILNVKFTQDVLPPKESGYINVDLDAKDEAGLYINNLGKDKGGYPVLWIKKMESFIPAPDLKMPISSVSAKSLFE